MPNREECGNGAGMPAISVIMPAHNAEPYIREAVDSILRQTWQDLELIILDDASTDGTWDVIRTLAVRDGRIVAVRNAANLGIADNRNKGLGLARGRYVAWQDADDISLPDRLELQTRFLDEHPEVAIVGGFLEFFGHGTPSVRMYPPDDAALRRLIFRCSPVAQPAAMLRRTALEQAGVYNPAYPPAEDLDMSFRLGCAHKFANLQQVVLRYRQHPGSATHTRLKTIELNTVEIRRRFFDHPAYRATTADRLYNSLQYISIFLVPFRLKIWIFNKLRNRRA